MLTNESNKFQVKLSSLCSRIKKIRKINFYNKKLSNEIVEMSSSITLSIRILVYEVFKILSKYFFLVFVC